MPRRCLHGVHPPGAIPTSTSNATLPRRCLHGVHLHAFRYALARVLLCLGAACTECIDTVRLDGVHWEVFASALPARSASPRCPATSPWPPSLPRRCLHGVHRQKSPNRGTPFCSIRRESVDSFSEINSKDSCADYFPALFCCQGDLHHHYRQPRTDNRPVLRCEQHRLFLFILSLHYRRLL